MKVPSLADRAVKVRAYLTDEVFGYTHWRAAQFCAPIVPSSRHAVLVVCDSEAERDALCEQLAKPGAAPEGAPPQKESEK